MIYPNKVSTFTERLNELMREKGLIQADLVKATGIERCKMSLYVSGRNEPKFEPAYRLALYLHVNPAWLMGFDVPRATAENKDYLAELNEEGREKVKSYIEDLLDNPKYRREEKTKIA